MVGVERTGRGVRERGRDGRWRRTEAPRSVTPDKSMAAHRVPVLSGDVGVACCTAGAGVAAMHQAAGMSQAGKKSVLIERLQEAARESSSSVGGGCRRAVGPRVEAGGGPHKCPRLLYDPLGGEPIHSSQWPGSSMMRPRRRAPPQGLRL